MSDSLVSVVESPFSTHVSHVWVPAMHAGGTWIEFKAPGRGLDVPDLCRIVTELVDERSVSLSLKMLILFFSVAKYFFSYCSFLKQN